MSTQISRKVFVGGSLATLLLTSGPAPAEETQRVSRSFPITRIKKIVLRAARADQARIISEPERTSVTVSGVPAGGAAGYHSPDPGWRETPAERWGLDFRSKTYGDTLVISTVNEVGYIHHRYAFRDIELSVPPDVRVLRQARSLSGRGDPDLTKPTDPPPREQRRPDGAAEPPP